MVVTGRPLGRAATRGDRSGHVRPRRRQPAPAVGQSLRDRDLLVLVLRPRAGDRWMALLLDPGERGRDRWWGLDVGRRWRRPVGPALLRELLAPEAAPGDLPGPGRVPDRHERRRRQIGRAHV